MEEIERELIGLILNNPKFIDELQVKSKYLDNENNRKLLEYLISIYKQQGCFTTNDLVNYDNYLLILDIWDETLYIKNNSERQIKELERKILINFKKKFIKHLNNELEEEKMSYEEFTKKIEDVSKINITNTSDNAMLTISDIDLSHNEEVEYIKSNTTELDSKIKGFALGQLSVWSGGNAASKSTYLNQIAIESIQQGYNVAIYSGELVASRLLKWLMNQCAGKQNMQYYAKGGYYFIDDYNKQCILNWLNNKLFIYNNNYGNKVRDIIDNLKQCIKLNNVKVLILDNLMSMDLNKYSDNKYDNQSLLIQNLSALAKELNVHIHFVCHPRKVTNFLRKIDISGSADLTNIADNVFIMHRINQDFRIKTKEMFKWSDDNPIYSYTNVIEVCKNRDFGVEDYFVGLYFEPESKRLKNSQNEMKEYGWKKTYVQERLGNL